MPKQRRTTKRISTLRTETQREQLAQLMFRGWSTKRIANALHCSPDTVRDLKGTVEFQTLYATYERAQLDRMDRALVAMLTEGITTLRRQLRHRDPWVRDAAIEKDFQDPREVRGETRYHGPARSRPSAGSALVARPAG
jgi:hypothetical protein